MMQPTDNRSLLMTYTVFHIGTYISLTAAILAAQTIGLGLGVVMRWSIALLVLASVCGAIVASHLPDSDSWESYVRMKIGPFGLPVARYRFWAKAEHLCVWIALLVPLALAAFCPEALKWGAKH
jgi:hypothetical protein